MIKFMYTKTNRGIKFKFSVRLLIGIALLAASSHVMSQTLAWNKALDLPQEFKTGQPYFYVNSISHNNLSSAMILSAYPDDGSGSHKYFLYWFGPKGEVIHKSELPLPGGYGYYNLAGMSSTRLAVRAIGVDGLDAVITYTRSAKKKVTSNTIKTVDQSYELVNASYKIILGSQDLFGFFAMQYQNGSIVLKRYNL